MTSVSSLASTDEMQAPLAEFMRNNMITDKKELCEPSPFVIREVSLHADGKAQDGITIIYYPDKTTLHIFIHGVNGLKHGFEKIYWPNGILKHKIEWNMGTKINRETTWHENGIVRSTINWKDGKETEILYTYYDDGQIRSEVPFREGQMHGTQRHYYCCGQIYAEINFFYGKRHGIEKSWHTNGKKKTQCTYVNDVIDDVEYHWDIDGLISEQANWKKGKLMQAVYYNNGIPIGAEIHKGNKVQIVDKMTPITKTKKSMTQKDIITAALEAKKKASIKK